MAAFNAKDKAQIQAAFDELLGYYSDINPNGNHALIKKAFKLANNAHDGMRRRSGEPYIMHPISVAIIVSKEIGLGATSISAALLHDVVEDTHFTVEDISERFGENIGSIVSGLTKIKTVTQGKEIGGSMQAENFKKLLLTMSEDFRVVLIKIADRLHNMRTLESMPARKQYKIAGETLFVYAPLAHRLGLFNIKTELENLSFKYEHPDHYAEVESKIQSSAKHRHELFEQLTEPIAKRLTELKVDFEIKERIKSVYSVWNKMQKKQVPFEEIYDITAIRIIFKPRPEISEKIQCWNIYTAVTDVHKPKPERLRDWVTTPKTNGYEALHVTVMGPQGRWYEVQIRSQRMNEVAEKGYAAHWKYKGGHEENETELEKWVKDVRELLQQSAGSSAIEFVDDFKRNLFSEEITVFTPKGDMHTLPVGATALDFAFDIHSELGLHCIGAKISNKLVPISYVLQNGDQVEILTSKKQRPQLSWTEMVITGKAKSRLKSVLKEEFKATIRQGMRVLEKGLHEHKLAINSPILNKLLRHYEMPNKEELYLAIGSGNNSLEDLDKALSKSRTKKMVRSWNLNLFNRLKQKSGISVKEKLALSDNESRVNYHVSECCNPIPGDNVVGVIEGDVVILHRRDCKNAIKLMANQGEGIVEAEWTSERKMAFLSQIKLTGFDRMGIVNKISKVISIEKNLNIRQFHFDAHDGVFEGRILFYVHSTQTINNVISQISKIKGVHTVVRLEQAQQDDVTNS